MRRLAAALALLAAVPAAAQDKPAWVGVWEGKVGTSPVRLCMEQWGDNPARGAYYYLSELEPVSLSEEDGEGGWVEDGPSEQDALWSFTELTGTAMRGNRRYLRLIAPFDLKPVPWTEGEWGGPCSSAAFIEPRLGPGEIVSEPAELGGWRYTRLTYTPPRQFTDEVSAASFAYPPEQPGDRAILAWLASHLPAGTMDDPAVECIAGANASVGADGFFDESLTPAMVSREFITVLESTGLYCGGAHPSYLTIDHTFDRVSGQQLDLFDWLGAPRREDEAWPLPDGLHALVVARWPADPEPDCRELAATTEYWTLGLAEDGLVFRPDFPHVATNCEEPVTVEWQALRPYLDAEGRAGLARLRGG